MALSKFMSGFQDSNPERFNQELITLRKTDSAETLLHDIFSSLSIEYVEYLGGKFVTNETESRKVLPRKKPLASIEGSRLDLFEAKFKIKCEEGEEVYTLPLYVPRLVDDYFFELNDNRFFAIYQVTDRNFYAIDTMVYLKTLLMPLGLNGGSSETVTFDSGYSINGIVHTIDFFNEGIRGNLKNIAFYYFIQYGIEASFDKIFNKHEDNVLIEREPLDEIPDGFEMITLIKEKLYAYVRFDGEPSETYSNMLTTFLSVFKGIRTSSNIDDELFWKKRIVKSVTSIKRAGRAMTSLLRVLDQRTLVNLKEIPDEYKEDTFSVLHWMMLNYNELVVMDSMDIKNRRLRLYEYMFFPLLRRLSDGTYRIFNSRNITLKRLRGLFSTINPYYIIRTLGKNELLRYYNATSTLDAFSVVLKWSATGAQSLNSRGVNVRLRGIHESYIGTIGLTASSASTVGLSGSLCPMATTLNGLFFGADVREELVDALTIYEEE